MGQKIVLKAYLESNDNGYSWTITRVDSLGGNVRKSMKDFIGLKLITMPEY